MPRKTINKEKYPNLAHYEEVKPVLDSIMRFLEAMIHDIQKDGRVLLLDSEHVDEPTDLLLYVFQYLNIDSQAVEQERAKLLEAFQKRQNG